MESETVYGDFIKRNIYIYIFFFLINGLFVFDLNILFSTERVRLFHSTQEYSLLSAH